MELGALNLLLTLGLCVLLLVLLGPKKPAARQPPTLYLLGLPGTRKTQAFYHLRGRDKVKTTTSVAPNTLELGDCRVVDVPGTLNPALFLRERIVANDVLCFFVDASTAQNIYASAGALHELLLSPAVTRAQPRVKVFNVQGPAAPTLAEFDAALQAEFRRLELSQQSGLSTEGKTAAEGGAESGRLSGAFGNAVEVGDLCVDEQLAGLRELL